MGNLRVSDEPHKADATEQSSRGYLPTERDDQGLSRSFSSDDHENTGSQQLSLRVADVNKSSYRPPQIGDFVQLLLSLSVEGPLDLTNHNMAEGHDDGNEEKPWYLGKPKQFKVYRNAYIPPSGPRTPPLDPREKPKPRIIHPVAVKKCHFPFVRGERLDLGSDKFRDQIPRYPSRNRRNIVKLIGWAVEDDYQPIPLLVIELALGHLGAFLKARSEDGDWSVKHQICLDMGAGLNAVHDAKIIHRDSKPSNVLIFAHSNSEVRFIAKIADFGLSATEPDHEFKGFLRVTDRTPGWHAPELDDFGIKPIFLTPSKYCKADNFSYGLVI